MAPTKKTQPQGGEKPAAEFITSAQLDAKLSSFGEELIKSVAALIPKAAEAPVAEVPKEVVAAGPRIQTNPEWESVAQEILGDNLDHTEFEYLKTGGVLFTVIIKREKSNAPEEYLLRMGQDRRSKEIGQEGTTGVESWCKLVKQNLSKAR